jgi:3-oxoacyl-[acyl-carrier protein] reductase
MTQQARTTVRFDFSKTHVVVTGGTTGIGRATAAAFLAAGAEVVITGQRAEPQGYEDLPRGATYRALKLEEADSVRRFADQLGSVDILVNNAGHTMPQADFLTGLQVNLVSVYELSNRLHAKLAKSMLPGGGSVVNIASMTSLFGSPYFPGYGAAKAGIVQLTKTLAAGWAKEGIRVNAVAPGSVPTAMTAKYAEDPAIREMVNAKTPMARWAEPQEIAQAILFLSSSAASFVTGHTLVVDGGYSIID